MSRSSLVRCLASLAARSVVPAEALAASPAVAPFELPAASMRLTSKSIDVKRQKSRFDEKTSMPRDWVWRKRRGAKKVIKGFSESEQYRRTFGTDYLLVCKAALFTISEPHLNSLLDGGSLHLAVDR